MEGLEKTYLLYDLEGYLCSLYDKYIDLELSRIDIIEKFIFTAEMLEPDLEIRHKWTSENK